MNTLDAIQNRRSIKHYDTSFKIPDGDIQKLIELAILAPSSYNIQNWRFLVVEDIELREKIQKLSFDQAQITEASHLIMVCADIKAWEKSMPNKWRNVSTELRDFMSNLAHQFYSGREQLQRDEAIRSASFASQNLMLAATAMGYGTCAMIGFDFDKVAELVNLPKNVLISNFIVVGKGIKEPFPRGGQLTLDEVLVKNKF